MVSLGPPEKPVIKQRYLHLMPEDKALWQKFIIGGHDLPEKVWYDVRVGNPMHVGLDQAEWLHRFAEYSTRKRIDIVGKSGLDYVVIEVKPNAGMIALGQAIFYSVAFVNEYRPAGEVIPAVLTDVCDPDIKPIMEMMGILVFEVGHVSFADSARFEKVTHSSINKTIS